MPETAIFAAAARGAYPYNRTNKMRTMIVPITHIQRPIRASKWPGYWAACWTVAAVGTGVAGCRRPRDRELFGFAATADAGAVLADGGAAGGAAAKGGAACAMLASRNPASASSARAFEG